MLICHILQYMHSFVFVALCIYSHPVANCFIVISFIYYSCFHTSHDPNWIWLWFLKWTPSFLKMDDFMVKRNKSASTTIFLLPFSRDVLAENPSSDDLTVPGQMFGCAVRSLNCSCLISWWHHLPVEYTLVALILSQQETLVEADRQDTRRFPYLDACCVGENFCCFNF